MFEKKNVVHAFHQIGCDLEKYYFTNHKIMNKILVLAIFIALLSCKTVQTIEHKAYDIVIQNVKLFDGDKIISTATVLVQDDKVARIITTKTNFVGDNVINGDGQTLIPGLIDAHVHAWDIAHTSTAAKAGVLTVLDQLNNQPNSLKFLKGLGNSESPNSEFYSAGYAVTVPRGHGTQFGPAPSVSSIEEVPGFIKERVESGSDWIKIIIEKGTLDQEFPTLSNEMVAKAIECSNQYNKLSVAHISNLQDAINATNMGIDGLVHYWGRDSTEISSTEISLMKEKGIFIVPTLHLIDLAKSFMPDVKIVHVNKGIKKLYDSGIPILAGTDAPNLDISYGKGLYEEMIKLADVGIPALEVLKSATSNTAKAFQLKNIGYLKKGFPANMILVNGDPTINITDIRNTTKIWKKGKLINNETKDLITQHK